MPPGSRRSHLKSRNGCGQCKKRHVRCNLQAPVCSNCQRRKVECDYFALSQPDLPPSKSKKTSSDLRHDPDNSGGGLWETATQALFESSPRSDLSSSASSTSPISQQFSTPLHSFEVQEGHTEILRLDPVSQDVNPLSFLWWKRVLGSQVFGFDYLRPLVASLTSIFRMSTCSPGSSLAYVPAIQENIEASNLFRRSGTEVNWTNWQAVLFFGIGMTIFQLAAAQSASDEAFDFLEMFHVLRQNSELVAKVGPYFDQSLLRAFLKQRQRQFRFSVDEQSLRAIQRLDTVTYPKSTSKESRQACLLAIKALEEWVVVVMGHPRNWSDFIGFPAVIQPEFVELLHGRHPVALLIYIHWCAFMHRSPGRWFLDGWARRAATAATVYLGPDWGDLLEWPMTVLATEPPSHSIEDLTGLAVLFHVAHGGV